MKDLGITKGEWWPCCKETRPHFIFVGEEEGTICGIHHNDPSEDNYDPLQRDIPTTERIANALLIADAGNTAQKCGLLPSELLRQMDELKASLRIIIDLHRLYFSEDGLPQKMRDVAEAAIKLTER